MNDRFMIRYWCKDSKKYLHSHKLVYNDGTYTQVSTKQSPNGTYYSYILYDWNTFELIPEQCTGLKDKNGQLIYEGDIVDIQEHIDSVNGLYRVIYDDINHCWALKRNEEFHYNYFTFSDLNGFAEDCEIAGNIHENPDLLEEK